MNKEEICKKVRELCEQAERDLMEKKKSLTYQMCYMKEHKFNMEQQALAYKQEGYDEADFILFDLKRKILDLFKDEE